MTAASFGQFKNNSKVVGSICAFVFAFYLANALPRAEAVTAAPAGTAASAVSTNLSKLEDRLYEHDYRSEDEATRLARLEKFVFGDVQTGSLDQRLANLNEAVVVAPSKPATPAATDSGKTYPTFDYGNYPRVNELEQHLLSMTYPKEPLQERLSRLETKVFGKPSTSNDIGARVDALDAYAERHDIFHERRPASEADQDMTPQSPLAVASQAQSDIQNPFTSGDDIKGVEQRVAAMETLVFGHQSGHPLAVRVQKLEKRLVPYDHSLPQKDMASQVDHLWTMLKMANTLNGTSVAKQAGGQSADEDDQTADSNTPTSPASHSWLHKLAKNMEASNGGGNGYNNMAFPAPGMPYVPGYGNGTAVWSPAF